MSARPRILVADSLAEDGVNRLREVGEVTVAVGLDEAGLVAIAGEFEAIVVRSATRITAPVIEAGASLRVIGRAGVGVDNIDLGAATRSGVVVVNAPRGNITAAAEHTIGLIFATARWVAQGDASMKRGEWARSRYTGVEIRGKVLGIVGLGNIGTEVAKRAQGLEMEVIAFDPVVSAERAEQFNVELVELDDLLRRSDFITVHVPLNEATRGLINAERLRLMKPTARLINAARGGVVDESALACALRDGVIAAAAADVFEEEPPTTQDLVGLPNFVATPHVAASTTEAQISVAFDVAGEVAAVLAGEMPRYAVNAPSMAAEELAYLRPFAALARRLGHLHRQLAGGRISTIELEFGGEVAEHDTGIITAAAIEGLLGGFTEERINAVNARLIASGRGIQLVERRLPRGTGTYPSLLTLRVSGFEVAGTVLFGEAHVVRIDAFRVDFVPQGHFLVSRHEDRPGVVGSVGTILGARDVNIASMQVGRDAPRGRALMLMEVDDAVGESVLGELRGVAGMEELRYVSLLDQFPGATG